MSRPRLTDQLNPVAGLAAVALFGIFAAVFVSAGFRAPTGFEAGVSNTESIGYALFDLVGQSAIQTEGFLIAFEIIDLVLVAALVGSIMLARRENQDETAMADGGREDDR